MGDTKRAIEVPWKGYGESDEGWIETIEMLPQGFKHALVRQRRGDGYCVDDGLKRRRGSGDMFGVAAQGKMGRDGRLNQIGQVFKIQGGEPLSTILFR